MERNYWNRYEIEEARALSHLQEITQPDPTTPSHVVILDKRTGEFHTIPLTDLQGDL